MTRNQIATKLSVSYAEPNEDENPKYDSILIGHKLNDPLW